jgi:hypothetical protein
MELRRMAAQWWAAKKIVVPTYNVMPILPLIDFTLTVSSISIGVGTIYGTASLAEMGFIDKDTLKLILSCVCPLVVMLQYISPIPVVLEALRKLDVQNLPTPVFQSQAACNILGLSYAIRIQNTTVLASNLFGIGCQILYLSSSHYVQSSNGRWLFFAAKWMVLLNAGLYVCTAVIPLSLLGQITTIVNVVLFAAPLAKMGTILRTRSATSLPTAMTVVSAMSNGLWTLYALLIADMIVLLPSLLGFLLSFFQVLVLLWCFNILPFDLSFLLLPCRNAGSTTTRSTKKVTSDEFGLQEWDNGSWKDATPPRETHNTEDSRASSSSDMHAGVMKFADI